MNSYALASYKVSHFDNFSENFHKFSVSEKNEKYLSSIFYISIFLEFIIKLSAALHQ